MILIQGFGDADLVLTQGYGIRTLSDRYKDQEPILVLADEPGIPELTELIESPLVYIINASNIKHASIISHVIQSSEFDAEVLEVAKVALANLLTNAAITSTGKTLSEITDLAEVDLPSYEPVDMRPPTIVQGASND